MCKKSSDISQSCTATLSGSPMPTPSPPMTGGCPSGPDWMLYAGVCYKFKISRGFTGQTYRQTTFSKAETDCQNDGPGAHLAMMKTPWPEFKIVYRTFYQKFRFSAVQSPTFTRKFKPLTDFSPHFHCLTIGT